MIITPRDYQTQCRSRIRASLDKGRKRPLIVLATGLGKTVIFCMEAEEFVEQTGKRVMVVAHRQELIYQAASKLKAVTGKYPDIEMGEEQADRYRWQRERYVVGSVQTLRGHRLTRFDPDEFGLLIIDEAHHATAQTYRDIIEHFGRNENLIVLGVTATPKRLDGVRMGSVFDSAPFIYGIREAVRDGWLVPIRQRITRVESLDLSWVQSRGGDFAKGQLAQEVEKDDNVLRFAAGVRDEAGDRKTIVFAASVPQAERMSELLEGMGKRVVAVHAKTPKERRREIFEQFSRGEITHVCNVGVLTEGFDEPTVECIAMCRPTQSETVYTQCLGRGTRPLPGVVDGPLSPEARRAAIAASAKRELLVLDFVGVSNKHRLVTAVDVLAGEHEPEDVKRRVQEIQEEDRGTGDMEDDIEQARAEIEAERARRVDEVKSARIKSVTYGVDVDPFDRLGVKRPPKSSPAMKQVASEAQVNGLMKWGVDEATARNMTKAEATRMMQHFATRKKWGYASYKQQLAMQKLGHPNWKSLKREEVDQIFQEIERDGWRKVAKRYARQQTMEATR